MGETLPEGTARHVCASDRELVSGVAQSAPRGPRQQRIAARQGRDTPRSAAGVPRSPGRGPRRPTTTRAHDAGRGDRDPSWSCEATRRRGLAALLPPARSWRTLVVSLPRSRPCSSCRLTTCATPLGMVACVMHKQTAALVAWLLGHMLLRRRVATLIWLACPPGDSVPRRGCHRSWAAP
jgi:hypothetical protein